MLAGGTAVWLLLGTSVAGAHVKWFSNFSFADEPRTFSEILTPTFFVLAVASIAAFVGLAHIDARVAPIGRYRYLEQRLASQAHHGPTIVRLATAAVLIVSWENHALLSPELGEEAKWIGWAELAVALSLLFPRATRSAGAGIVILWIAGAFVHSAFHLLDYFHFVGIGIYLSVCEDQRPERREVGLRALYFTVGFALIWAGFEKLVYPTWALVVLDQNPQLAFGLPEEFFVSGSAFVEIGLGFLLVIGLLKRPTAALITIVFTGSAFVFGRVEVVGHTPLHAALVVFLLSGPITIYRPPIAMNRNLSQRSGFIAGSFAIILALFAFTYSAAARAQFIHQADDPANHARTALAETAPTIDYLTVDFDPQGGAIIRLHTGNWTFTTPGSAATATSDSGFADIFVDGQFADRAYTDVAYLGPMPAGDHSIRIELHSSDSRPIHVDGEPVSATTSLTLG